MENKETEAAGAAQWKNGCLASVRPNVEHQDQSKQHRMGEGEDREENATEGKRKEETV